MEKTKYVGALWINKNEKNKAWKILYGKIKVGAIREWISSMSDDEEISVYITKNEKKNDSQPDFQVVIDAYKKKEQPAQNDFEAAGSADFASNDNSGTDDPEIPF